ncbi:MFS transporter [Bacillus mycoides]|uniref:MFS transporter n=1 Tax=Bacillus mycoides TaxID=1405 RepID=UPI001F406500|nr:MFS transporter [Bacillus mycoides]
MPIIPNESHSTKIIVMVALATALSLLGDSMLYIVLPIYWKEAGLDSIWQVGILLSINRIIRLPFNPFVGWLYQRISLKTGLILAIILGSITTLGYGIAQSFVFWLVLRGLWGIAWSFFRIGGLTTIVYFANDNNRGKLMGLYNGLFRLGSLFGMLLGGIFVPIVGLKFISIFFGCLSLIGILLVIKSLKTRLTKQNSKEHKVEGSISICSSLKYKILVVTSGFFITLIFQGIFTSTLSAIIAHYYGQNITLFGIVISVTFLSGVIQAIRWMWEPYLGSKFGDWSDGQKGRLPLYISSLAFVGVPFGIISNHVSLIIWFTVILLVMLGATALTTLTDALASDIAKVSNAVSFLTVYSIVQDIGAAVGPVISYALLMLDDGFIYLYWGGSTHPST